MKAISLTGSSIVGTADLVPGNALIVDGSWRLEGSHGSPEFDWAGDTEMCWDGQQTVTRGGVKDAAEDLLKALKEIADNPRVMDTMITPQTREKILAAIAKAELPEKPLYVDEAGEEWTEDQITLVNGEEEAEHAAPAPA